MSKNPRRWELQWTGLGDDFDMVENPKGNYVLMEDYARLKAEVERLRASSFMTAVSVEEYEKLKAEVERLTKLCQATSPDGFIHIRDINAAKEGKQP